MAHDQPAKGFGNGVAVLVGCNPLKLKVRGVNWLHFATQV